MLDATAAAKLTASKRSAPLGPPSLRLKDIRITLGKALRLSIADFKIAAGERVLIHGPSGQGKTTLLHLLAGLIVPDCGEVWIGPTNLRQLSERQRSQLRRRDFGIIFQSLNLLDHLTAVENVLLAGGRTALSRHAALVALAQVDMEAYSEDSTASLSLGQQQRIAAARMLVAEPKVILADEPTSSLDEANVELLMDALDAAAKGATLVMVSHDQRIRARFRRVISINEVFNR